MIILSTAPSLTAWKISKILLSWTSVATTSKVQFHRLFLFLPILLVCFWGAITSVAPFLLKSET
uniref:Uncharacterized protein n=1 Tax=Rhizophora mucronata TaxID=61149 RepID=A0A2P2IQF3_RHIMU